jgi:uncharacterized protein YjbI with pentapeptide repeats
MAVFKISHRFTGAILFELECGSLKLCVEAAVKSGAYLGGADLHGAYLRGAYLRGAYLRGAYLGGANLDGADLHGAYLDGADLHGADLQGANLAGAYLDGFKIDGLIGIIDAGTPNNFFARGYVDQETRALRVQVGCRHFEIGEGRGYWSDNHPEIENRREVLAAVDYIEAVARLRGWTGKASEKEAA